MREAGLCCLFVMLTKVARRVKELFGDDRRAQGYILLGVPNDFAAWRQGITGLLRMHQGLVGCFQTGVATLK